ncbi:MAG TPA: glycosyltransferase family 4 protein, partial [Vicinamibacterales bacterium]|nr:glycosyltransferase family 4 protein [Vicinamibacterales bacterium]
FVGVIAPDKQPHVLLDAWARLQADSATRCAVVFVGATNPELYELGDRLIDTLRATVDRLGLSAGARFVEPTSSIEHYFRAADMLVLPSIREGCPNVVLEAMACGLPVVASRLPGATDAIIQDGVNGLLADVGDAEGFARAIGILLRDRPFAARVGLAARRTIEDRYSIEDVAEQWLAIYESVARP